MLRRLLRNVSCELEAIFGLRRRREKNNSDASEFGSDSSEKCANTHTLSIVAGMRKNTKKLILVYHSTTYKWLVVVEQFAARERSRQIQM